MSSKRHKCAILLSLVALLLLPSLSGCTSCEQQAEVQRRRYERSHRRERPRPALPVKETTTESVAVKEAVDEASAVDERRLLTGEEVYERCHEAVFTVFATDGVESVSQGSGFFVTPGGLGVTNYHVIAGMDLYQLYLKLIGSDRLIRITEIIATDPEVDYVVFRTEETAQVPFIPVSREMPKVGERVFAIGSPRGLENTFTSGEVSQYRGDCLIQVSAPIDHGSSGGALINAYGEAIGLTTAGMEGNSSLNFVVPITCLPL